MESITIYGHVDSDLANTVQLLRERNVGVTILDERELNAINVNKELQRQQLASCSGKRKGKENEIHHATSNDQVISKAALGQRKRRERERLHRHIVSSSFTNQICIGESSSHVGRLLPPSSTTINTQPGIYEGCNVRHVAQHNQPIIVAPVSNHTGVNQFDNRSPSYSRAHSVSQRHFLGLMNVVCPFCSALHWIEEKLSNSSSVNPLFGKCCSQGKVKLPELITPLPPLQALYDGVGVQSTSFRTHIRQYNAANAFTSLGVSMDQRALPGRGPTSFTIHGELRHRTGSLIPQAGQIPVYAQLYIYDPTTALYLRSSRNSNLRVDVLQLIQDCLEFNDFTEKYRQAYEILNQPGNLNNNLPAVLHYNSSSDNRRYNLPTSDEVAVILPGDGTELSGLRDIIVSLRGGHQLMQISECHPAYLPLHYVLLFPFGELGWEPTFKQWDPINDIPSTTRLTQMQYYSFRLFQRNTEYSTILRGKKLFQEFLVDAWASTEQNRLTYHRLNKKKLRAELYQGLTDVGADGFGLDQVGRRIILPSSFTGSARYMFEIFQDSMAITRYYQHPDIFLTMTANPKWPEIKTALLPHQSASDRPDLIARVFELKRIALMREIDRKNIFGKKVAHVYTIEFQKRGLPHMHALIFLTNSDKIRNCQQVDKFVSAEFPDPNEDPLLFQTVINCMVHGPCGIRNPTAQCMENNKCKKKYPRELTQSTTMSEDGYPIYRRRNTGNVYTVKKNNFDNRDVVPYNPYLSKMFDCHINVEVCAGLRCVKYIHKYIFKGNDRATMVLGGVDEIKQYLDSRYIGPPEAAWRLFGHSMHEEVPSVVRLALHLPDNHNVVYNSDEIAEDVLARARHQMTTLTGYFACCSVNEVARAFTYQEFPQHFVWKKDQQIWTKRQRGFSIGRMYFANPREGERFYLRLLLTVTKGATSYEYLRTVDNVVHPTFKLACNARGLLEDDGEWVQCLEEAAVMSTGYQLRRLFSVILTECSPLEPLILWNLFSVHICDDLAHKLRTLFFIPNPTISQVADYGLYLLNQMLQESGKSLDDFPPMPHSIENWSTVVGNKFIWEHRLLQEEARQTDVQNSIQLLNDEQRSAYTTILTSVMECSGKTFFLNGGAGTGKTFLYNTLSSKCRSDGLIVITVASSGIASLLLVGGRTAHSTFSIPLDILENSFCSFSKQSAQAELFRETNLIIWDEVPMQNRFCVEAVDRTLQDIRDNTKPFGGITVVLGGDFRQILPVVPRGVREQVVGASLRRSYIWNNLQVLTLRVNMRLDSSEPGNISFANFLNEIGTNPEEIVHLPRSIRRCHNLNELISTIYPQLNVEGTMTPTFLTERTILSARNDDVNYINDTALHTSPGPTYKFLAADKMCEDDEIDRNITDRYPYEFLNSLNPPGLPPFELDLKVGCPIILLRNIAPKDGLCNGTRLVVVRCGPNHEGGRPSRVIEAMILTGDKAGNMVFIPRIPLTPSSSDLPFQMTRRQFPVRLAYSVTMNKSQGQSVRVVGIDLRSPVFSHGQLYVALSRCTNFDRICLLLPEEGSSTTTNIVYPEVLLQF